MTDYTKKYKNLDNFEKRYKPLEFRLFGIKFRERLPYFPKFLDPVFDTYAYWRSRLGTRLSYFDLRFGFSPAGRKKADMHFLTHYISDHVRGNEKPSLSETIHYHLIKLRYLPELYYVNSIFYSPESPKHPKQSTIDLYMIRWGYLLDVQPSFVNLVHGTDHDAAIDVIANFQ